MSETTSSHIITSVPTQAELMSSSFTPEVAELPTTAVSMPKNGLGVTGELLPFFQRVLRNSDGKEITTNIFASITRPGSTKMVVLFGDKDKKWLAEVVDGSVITEWQGLEGNRTAALIPTPSVAKKAGVYISKSQDPADGYSWVFRMTTQRGVRAGDYKITFAEDTGYIKNPRSHAEKKYNNDRRKNIVKKLSGAAAVIATLSPGGLIDKAIDPVVDTVGVVREAGTSMHQHVYAPDDYFDGMDLKNHPDILADINKEAEIRNAEIDKVADVAARTMLDLDSHDYNAIQKRADEYIQRNPENFMDGTTITTMREDIAAATTNDEVLAALRPLMDFYGKEVIINTSTGEVTVSSAKAIAAALVNEIGKYPKVIVEKAELDTIVIQRLNTDEKNSDIRAGDYTPYERRIRINAFSELAMVVGAVQNATPVLSDLAGVGTYEAMIAHEFAHALTGGRLSTAYWGDGPSDFIRDVAGALVDYPEVISMYSRSNFAERDAENISGVLSGRADGLTHPDDSRRFVSPANKALLAKLISFGLAERGEAAVDPGVIDYLVARNPRLMGRSFIGLGH